MSSFSGFSDGPSAQASAPGREAEQGINVSSILDCPSQGKSSCRGGSETASVSSKDSSSTDSEGAGSQTKSPSRKLPVNIHYDDGPSRMSSHEAITFNQYHYSTPFTTDMCFKTGSSHIHSQAYSKGQEAVTDAQYGTTFASMKDDSVQTLQRGESTKDVNVAARIQQFSANCLVQGRPTFPFAAPAWGGRLPKNGNHGVPIQNDRGHHIQEDTTPNHQVTAPSSGGLRRIHSLVSSRTTSSRSGSLHSVQEEEESVSSESLHDADDDERTMETGRNDGHDLFSTDEESYLEDSTADIESIHTENPQFIAIGIVTTSCTEEEWNQESFETLAKAANDSNKKAEISEAVAKDIAREEHNLKEQARAMNTSVDAIRRRSAPSILAARRSSCEDAAMMNRGNGSTRSSFRETGVLGEDVAPGEKTSQLSSSTKKNILPTAVAPVSTPTRVDNFSGSNSRGFAAFSSSCARRDLQRSETDREAKLRAMRGASGTESTVRRQRTGIIHSGRTPSDTSISQPLAPSRSLSMSSTMEGSSQAASSSASFGYNPNLEGNNEGQSSEDDVSVCPSLQTIQTTRSTRSISSGITLDEKTTERIALSSALRSRRPVRTNSGEANENSATAPAPIPSGSSGSKDDRKMSATVSSTPSPSSQAGGEKNVGFTSRASPFTTDSSITSNRPSDDKAAYRTHGSLSTGSIGMPPSRAPERMPSASEHSSVDSHDYPEIHEELPMQACASNCDDDDTEDLEAQAGVPVLLPGAFAVGGIEEEGDGYDSGYDDSNSVSGGIEVVEDGDPAQGIPIDSVTGSVQTTSPLQAELYEEESFVDAEVLVEEEEDVDEKVLRRSCLVQIFCAVFVILAIVGIVIGVVLPRTSKKKSNPAALDDVDRVKKLEGWDQIGEILVGPTYKDNIRFGNSVSISGDGTRMAVGLPGADDDGLDNLKSTGSVLIYDLVNGTAWEEVFQIDGLFSNAESGTRVVLSESGNRVAIGAPAFSAGRSGYVAVYEESRSTGDWAMIGSSITSDEIVEEVFGDSIAFSADGSIVAIGDKYSDRDVDGAEDIGLVRVFREFNHTWVQMGDDLYGSGSSERFGWAIALSGDGSRLVASSLGTSEVPGSVQSFDFVDDAWQEIGSRLIGESPREAFGASITLSADGLRLAIGATSYSRGGGEAGVGVVRSYLYDESQSDWIPFGKPLEGLNQFDAYGSSVDMSSTGDVLAIGGPGNQDFCENCGHIQVFRSVEGDWKRIGSEIGKDESDGGQLGFSLALSSTGTRVVGAAPFTTFDGFVSKVGQVTVFDVADEEEEEKEDKTT